MDKRMTILINSPDSYSDVFSVFLQCKEKNWRNCRYELVLSTNTKEYKGLTVLHSGGKSGNSWMDREILALNFISTKYIMIMCEDSLIMSQVEESLLENILDDMDNYGINYCKLTAPYTGEAMGKSGLLTKVKKNRPYARNLMIGIYNRKYLLDLIGDGSKSPWEIESEWLKETHTAKNEYFSDITVANRDILYATNAVLKGRWFSSALKSLKEIGIYVKPERDVIGVKEEKIINCYSLLGHKIPPRLRPTLKKIGKLMGLKFASDN